MTRVLIDYHHADLAHSFALTFGDRFGWEVYHPYGMEWFEQWYWGFEREWHGDAVAKQYLLGIWDAHPIAKQWEYGPDGPSAFRVIPDTRHPGRELRGVSLDDAKQMEWDIVISSVPGNAVGFSKFAEQVGARWGIHVGNQWGDEAWQRRPSFAILSTTSDVPAGIPHVVVHQEFSLEDFRYEPPTEFGPMRSFVNCFQETPEYAQFLQTARGLPEFEWDVYGALGSAQADEFTRYELHGTPTIGDAMRGAGAIWHAKHWSDGFGHVIHNAFAVGRPVFGYQRYYADKLAGPLWVEGVTSYDIERRSRQAIGDLIAGLRDNPAWYREMCEASAARFREVVSFDEDAEQLRRLLDG